MKRAAIVLVPLSLLLTACPSGNKQDNTNARDVRLSELYHQYHCHTGDFRAHEDQGAIMEPKGVDNANKLGYVVYSQAVQLADKYDVIYWCGG